MEVGGWAETVAGRLLEPASNDAARHAAALKPKKSQPPRQAGSPGAGRS